MTLPNDTSRCRGVWKHGLCSRREECARYIERNTGGERTPQSVCMCPGLDEYWQHFIPVIPVEKPE